MNNVDKLQEKLPGRNISPGEGIITGGGLRNDDYAALPAVSIDGQSAATSTKQPDTDIPPRTHGGNSKFMGDAETFATPRTVDPQATGKVVKGDKRGGGADEFPPLPPSTFINSGHGPDPNAAPAIVSLSSPNPGVVT